MTFKAKYTTDALWTADPEGEKNKISLSDVEYLRAEQQEEMNNELKELNLRLRKMSNG